MDHTGRPLVCLVTGATGGIGLATAVGLAASGAHVILGARNQAGGASALRAVAGAAGSDRLEVAVADLSVQAEVRRMAAEIVAAHPRVDVLVNNAGLVSVRREETADGFELTWAVNHLAPFLLTNLLTGLLVASAPARVVTVSSGAHMGATLELDDLQFERRRYSALAAYGQSKLANVLFTAELARRLRDSGVTANSLHPGLVGSDFGSRGGGLVGLGWRLLRPFALSPEKGARTSRYLATSPEVAGVTGRYFVGGRRVEPSPLARDPDLARRLWDVSAAMTGLT